MKTILAILLTFSLLSSCSGQSVQHGDKSGSDKISYRKVACDYDFQNVTCGFLDRNGTLWFGTHNTGVFSFNGTSFTNYTKEDGLCNNNVSCITEDQNGKLWFGTANGLCVYDRKTFRHISIPVSGPSTKWLRETYPAVNANEVQSILQDKNGIFWLGTNGAGAYRYDGTTFTGYLSKVGKKQSDGLHHNIIQSIVEDKKGNIWFASMTHGGVSRYDGESFTHFTLEDGLSDDMVRTCFVDNTGIVWFGFNGNGKSALTFYDGNSFTSFYGRDSICSKHIRGVYQDKSGKLWIGGRDDLCIYDGKVFARFTTAENHSFDNLTFVTGDKYSNVWFGGKDGLWRFDGKVVSEMIR